MLYNVLLVSAAQQAWLLSTMLSSPYCAAASHRLSLLHTECVQVRATLSVHPALSFPGCAHKSFVYVCISILSCKQVHFSAFRPLPVLAVADSGAGSAGREAPAGSSPALHPAWGASWTQFIQPVKQFCNGVLLSLVFYQRLTLWYIETNWMVREAIPVEGEGVDNPSDSSGNVGGNVRVDIQRTESFLLDGAPPGRDRPPPCCVLGVLCRLDPACCSVLCLDSLSERRSRVQVRPAEDNTGTAAPAEGRAGRVRAERGQPRAWRRIWMTEFYTRISKFNRSVDGWYDYAFVPSNLLWETWENKTNP